MEKNEDDRRIDVTADVELLTARMISRARYGSATLTVT